MLKEYAISDILDFPSVEIWKWLNTTILSGESIRVNVSERIVVEKNIRKSVMAGFFFQQML